MLGTLQGTITYPTKREKENHPLKMPFLVDMLVLRGVVVSHFFFSPRTLGEDEPGLTIIFFKWVGSTTNQYGIFTYIWPKFMVHVGNRPYIEYLVYTMISSSHGVPWQHGPKNSLHFPT